VGNDGAIEVLAHLVPDARPYERQRVAAKQVEALASAGFQITDLTPDEAQSMMYDPPRPADYSVAEWNRLRQSARAKLRILASSPSGEETRERNEDG
jgi:hypothetical protein